MTQAEKATAFAQMHQPGQAGDQLLVSNGSASSGSYDVGSPGARSRIVKMIRLINTSVGIAKSERLMANRSTTPPSWLWSRRVRTRSGPRLCG